MSPFESDDLTDLVEQDGNEFVALRSPEDAEDNPDYEELGRFSSRDNAKEFLRSYQPD